MPSDPNQPLTEAEMMALLNENALAVAAAEQERIEQREQLRAEILETELAAIEASGLNDN